MLFLGFLWFIQIDVSCDLESRYFILVSWD